MAIEEGAPEWQQGEMKGRITVFSISGCPHCRAAKTLLKKKGAQYVEINLDVYPERRPEMEAIAKKSSAPQIFFNAELIGGNDSLQALNAAGGLEEKLKSVWEHEAPTTAPAPPGPVAEGDKNGTEQVLVAQPDEFADLVQRMRDGVAVKDHFRQLHLVKACFKGSDAVDFISKDKKCSRQEAVEIGKKLLAKHFFHHNTREHDFEDGNHLYRFLEHEPALVNEKCLNFNGKVDSREPGVATEVGDKLRKLILAIYDQFLSEDGRAVDYKGIAASDVFRRYKLEAEALQRLELEGLTRSEKLAFFINVYNALVVHATAVIGHGPENAVERDRFFNGYGYVMGGCVYTLNEIESGLLRANRRPPYKLFKLFSKKDPRINVALTEHEPLIHFALVCGAKSCPPIKTYKANNVMDQLGAAARAFFQDGGCEVDVEKKEVSLSKILFWYHVDFGSDDKEMLTWIAQHLDGEVQKQLLNLVESGNFKVTYQPYDWGSNSH